MKKKLFLLTTLLVLGGGAGIYTVFAASPDQPKLKVEQKVETKELEQVKEEKNREKTAAKLGVSLEGKTEKEITGANR